MPPLRDRVLPIVNPIAILADILILGFTFPVQSTKLWLPLRLAVTLLGLVCVAWVFVTTYHHYGVLPAVALFALTNAALAVLWYCFILLLGIKMMFDINRRA